MITNVKKTILFGLFLFFLLIFSFEFENISAASAEILKCDICGNAIEGKYFKYKSSESSEETIVCQNCSETLPKCQLCRRIMKNENLYDGMKVCDSCINRINTSPDCYLCQKKIYSGTYFMFEDPDMREKTYVCQNCLNTYEKCDLCKVPRRNIDIINNTKVCYYCQKKLKKCYSCGNLILRTSYNYDIVNQVYCPDCEKKTPKCDCCGLPAGNSPVILSDGRKICPDCESTAVKDIDSVKFIYDAVATFLKKEYNMAIGHVNQISFKELSEMEKLGKLVPGSDENKSIPLGLFMRTGDNFDIYVQKNLPRSLLTGVLAHEYAHSYMSNVNSAKIDNMEINEGFAEWIRYKVLAYIGDNAGMKLIEKRTDVYGRGYQLFKRAEDEKGLGGVFGLITENKK